MVPNSLDEKPEEMNLRSSKNQWHIYYRGSYTCIEHKKNGCEWDRAYNGFHNIAEHMERGSNENGS